MAVMTADEQRFAALEVANPIRMHRAEFKRALKAKERWIEDAIREPEWFIQSMPVFQLLACAPRLGPEKVNRILRRADVWPLRETGLLTVGQRDRLIAAVRGYPAVSGLPARRWEVAA